MFERKDIEELLGSAPLNAFAKGAGRALSENRNRNIGAMFSSDHVVEYIQILYRMLLFRREYELEPLYEHIFSAVAPAIEAIRESKEDYPREEFDRHMNQLYDWHLIDRRLEKERLRGYKDVRRDRYRCRLADESAAFLQWLEERLHGEFISHPDDTENLLEFVLSRLRDINSELNKLDKAREENSEEKAASCSSSIIFYMYNADENTGKISRRLSEISTVLSEFLTEIYSFDRAKTIVSELGAYMEAYLRRISQLRRKINIELEKLSTEETKNRLLECLGLYEKQLGKIPSFLRRAGHAEGPAAIIGRLRDYYQRQGRIDLFCGRVNDAAVKVRAKLSAYLREVERKNNRLEFLSRRIKELAALPSEADASAFLFDLIRPALAPLDSNYWDKYTKAEPPVPRHSDRQKRQPPRIPIEKHKHGGDIPQTLEDAKLQKLRKWLEEKFPQADGKKPSSITDTEYKGIEDFYSFMQLAKYGILGNGNALKKIGYGLKLQRSEAMFLIEDERHSLEIPEMFLERRENE